MAKINISNSVLANIKQKLHMHVSYKEYELNRKKSIEKKIGMTYKSEVQIEENDIGQWHR